MSLPIMSREARRNFSEIEIIKKNIFPSTMLEERLNYLSGLSVENYIKNSLSYDEAIKKYAAKRT